jgi:hypothetical protein
MRLEVVEPGLTAEPPMSCWVVPTIAAELWGVTLDQVLVQIRAGALSARVDHGFVVVDVAPGADHVTDVPRSEPPPTTFAPADAFAPAELSTSALLSEAERSALGGPLESPEGWHSWNDDQDDLAAGEGNGVVAEAPTDAVPPPVADELPPAVEDVVEPSVELTVEAVAVIDVESAGLTRADADLGTPSTARLFPSEPPAVDLMADELAALAACSPPEPLTVAAGEVPTPGDEAPRPARRRAGRFRFGRPAPAPLPTPAAVEEDEMGPDPNDGEPDDGKPLDWRAARAKAATRRRPPPGRF